MHVHARLLAAICTASLTFAQGAVFQVSPSGAITDIQTAVNMAGDGDLIEVAPGAYPAFSVSGKRLSVVGIDPVTNAPATFTVLGAPNTEAIRIDGLTPGQLVTVSGARIVHTNTTAAAIVIANNPSGHVHLLDVVVTTLTNLGAVPYEGVVEVANTRSVWFDRVRAGDHRVFASGASGATLAGLFCDASQLHLNQCDFRGLRSANLNVAGGDGLRTVGLATVWMVDTVLYGGMSSAGLAPNTLGGHAVHDFDGQAGLIRACDCTLVPAIATVSAFAIAGAQAFLAACSDERISRTSLAPPTSALRIGTSTTVTVSANVGNRAFVLVIADDVEHLQAPGVFTGAFLFTGNVVSLVGGVVGVTPFQYPLQLPNVPTAIGMHLTLQSGLLNLSGSTLTWSMSTAAGFTVR